MKAHRYLFLTLSLMALTFLFSGQALAADIDATLPDSDNASSFQVKNSASTVLMKVQSGGNVGIGTTTPDANAKLDVNGNVQISGASGKLVFPASHYGVKIELYGAGEERIGTADNQLQLISGNLTGANIAFFGAPAGSASLTEVMRVETDSGGKVGIGTTAPKEKFQIGDRFTFNGQNDGANSWRVISDNAYYDGTNDRRIVADFAAAMAFTDGGDILFRTAGTGPAGGILDNGDYSTWDTLTAPLVVKNDGKIGIGTGAPNSTLHVNGSIAVKRTPVDTGTADSSGETIIGITTTGACEITLLAAHCVEGRVIVIKDESGASRVSADLITVTAAGTTIDGESSQTISGQYGYIKVYSNGTKWFIIGRYNVGGV